MGWPVEWLKRMISAREFDMWCKYFERRPFDDESVHHVPIALLTSTYVNSQLPKGADGTTASDFLVFRKKEPEKPADVGAKFVAFLSRFKLFQKKPGPA